MLTLIYPYRNRSPHRLKKSFDSLLNQTDDLFEVHFIDYGSDLVLAKDIKKLCSSYQFINYQYYHTYRQPWNKSKALNSIIRYLKSDFCFVADVDIIFHKKFVETARKKMKVGTTTYFKVGYLDSVESQKELEFSNYQISRLSTSEATGLSLFPVQQLKELNGFDEFYHFWGSEDTDMHVRLENAGYDVRFYDEELLLLHQWHPSYQSQERTNTLTDLRVSGIVPLNHQYLKTAKALGSTKVNLEGWGQCITEEESRELEATEVSVSVTNEKRQVDDILFGQWPGIKNGIIKISFKLDPFQQSTKYHIKKKLGRKVPHYYTFQEMNDQVILHLISFYRNLPYSINSNKNKGEIEVAIKFS
jgi:glycosyltransferase involved in cell wall biosynthesis